MEVGRGLCCCFIDILRRGISVIRVKFCLPCRSFGMCWCSSRFTHKQLTTREKILITIFKYCDRYLATFVCQNDICTWVCWCAKYAVPHLEKESIQIDDKFRCVLVLIGIFLCQYPIFDRNGEKIVIWSYRIWLNDATFYWATGRHLKLIVDIRLEWDVSGYRL